MTWSTSIRKTFFNALETRLALFDLRTILAFALPFMVYVSTLAPTIYNLDSAELTTAAATGGIIRATGYPLYLLLGRVWSWLPLGDVGYRMNLFSAFNGALTIALIAQILRRWRVGFWATLGALGLLAASTFFWALSLIAEVYTLHTALMAGLILALLAWQENPSPRKLGVIGLLTGLSMGNHVATVLLIPGAVWFLLTTHFRRVLSPRSLLWGIGGALLGFSVYFYLSWQYGTSPAFNYAGYYDAAGVFHPRNLQTAAGLWWLITGRSFAGQMFAYRGADLWLETVNFGIHLWRAFLALGIGPGLLGLVVLLRRNWRLGGMLVLMFVISAFFYIDYRVIDKETMFLPTYVIWTLWLGIGYQSLLDWLKQSHHRWGEATLKALMVGGVLFAVLWNWRLVDQSGDWSARQRSEAIFQLAEPNALVFGWWGTAPALEYLQLVEGQRPDVQVVNRFLIAPEDMRKLIQAEIARRPVYIDMPSEYFLQLDGETLDAEPAGPVYRLNVKIISE